LSAKLWRIHPERERAARQHSCANTCAGGRACTALNTRLCDRAGAWPTVCPQSVCVCVCMHAHAHVRPRMPATYIVIHCTHTLEGGRYSRGRTAMQARAGTRAPLNPPSPLIPAGLRQTPNELEPDCALLHARPTACTIVHAVGRAH